jgi:hypothetical protein
MTQYNCVVATYDDKYSNSVPERSKTPVPFDCVEPLIKHSEPIPIPIKKLQFRISPWDSVSPYAHSLSYSPPPLIFSAPENRIKYLRQPKINFPVEMAPHSPINLQIVSPTDGYRFFHILDDLDE